MWDFRKKRQDQEQQRRVERVLEAQEVFLVLYEQLDKSVSQAAEMDAVKASFERGRDEFLR